MSEVKDENVEAQKKRRYEAPRVVEEVVFETLALSCTGSNPTDCKGPFLSS